MDSTGPRSISEAGGSDRRILPAVRFEPGVAGSSRRLSARGRIEPGSPDWVYLPIQMPRGVARLDLAYTYDDPDPGPGARRNALDIGIFDEGGIEVGASAGFRGWSGGARRGFSLGAAGATPGYLAGPIRAGTWYLVLGPYTIAPQGLAWTVEVGCRFGPDEPAPSLHYPPDDVMGFRPGWFRGDLHVHTVYSDGARTPEEVAAAARAAGLDFLNSAEHNTSAAHPAWGGVTGDRLLVLTGEEPTTRNGHFLAVGLPPGSWVDWRYRARDHVLPEILRRLHGTGALAIVAHPFADCPGCGWRFGYEGFDAVEVWNGPWTADDEVALLAWEAAMLHATATERWRWLPAVGGSDAHREPDRVGLPQTVVRARSLSRDAILEGLAAGRAWIAESREVQLRFRLRAGGLEADIGERLCVPGPTPVDVELRVGGVPGGVARVLGDQGELWCATLPGSGKATLRWRTSPQASAWVRAEVRHAPAGQTPPGAGPVAPASARGAMAALTNPIFLGEARGSPSPPAPGRDTKRVHSGCARRSPDPANMIAYPLPGAPKLRE